MSYNPADIEQKWQKRWEEDGLYQAKDDDPRAKYYALDMFPYPSGDLHIGHWYAFVGPDINARYHRMQGYNVMQPIGFDAFGLPAENAAIKRGLHPHSWTQQNITSMRNQFAKTGFSFDWSRMVDTSVPQYYKWTQWMFLQLYKKGLAYRKKQSVNWCEHDQTVLANEQVENGMCWRCGNPVIQKDLEQWFFKITDYAQQLLDDLDGLDWPATTKQMQKNWIGQSHGATITFKAVLADHAKKQQERSISVFTTRPDTLFGVSYIVLAPEHPLVISTASPDRRQAVEQYIDQAKHRTERDRLSAADLKTGVATGGRAVHPLTGKEVPIWVADYVLGSYGTGAVMGVPAHDERDRQFAEKHHLPIIPVIQENESGSEVLINSEQFNGLVPEEGRSAIIKKLQEVNAGHATTTYRLRDWLISRQRYWGPPVPMIDCPKCGWVPVPEKDLPVVLPEDVDFLPKGKAPLETNSEFMNTTCPNCHGAAVRASETLDTFVDSSWYFFRYPDPHNQAEPFAKDKVQHWMPADIYVGGAEHTVLHLLYSRFFNKALRDLGYVNVDEPFSRLRHQGMILGPDHQKMSKSKGNVVNPDELVDQFGADAVRMQLVFLGPYSEGSPWQLTGIHGVYRFLQRVFNEQQKRQEQWTDTSDPEVQSSISNTAARVAEDIQQFKFNTAVAELMKTINVVTKAKKVSAGDWQKLLITLAPFAPFLTEELWHLLGNTDSIHVQRWPEAVLSQKQSTETTAIAVQVNGKFRATIQVGPGDSEQVLVEIAKQAPAVARHIQDQKVQRTIFVPGKVLNLIIS